MSTALWKPLCGALIPLAVLILVVLLLRVLTHRRPLKFIGSHVLITGGSSGIGLCMAQFLLSAGARVTIVGRNEKRLDAARATLAVNHESHVAAIAADCTDVAAVADMVRSAEALHGPIDLLVAAAGGASGGRFDEIPASALAEGMNANFLSAALPAHAVFKGMASRGSGHICFVGSMASVFGVFGYSCYAPGKFAVRGLAEVLYYEGAHRGVGVTLVLPPDTDTPGYRAEVEVLPAESLAISQGSGVFTAEQVAKAAVEGIRKRRYRVTVGLDGAMLGMLTAGMTPGVNMLEVVCIPFLRIASAFYVWNFKKIIKTEYEKRMAKTSDKEEVRE